MENFKIYRWFVGGYWGDYGYVGWRRITQGEYYLDKAKYWERENYHEH